MAQLKEAVCDEMDVDCKGGRVGPRLGPVRLGVD